MDDEALALLVLYLVDCLIALDFPPQMSHQDTGNRDINEDENFFAQVFRIQKQVFGYEIRHKL